MIKHVPDIFTVTILFVFTEILGGFGLSQGGRRSQPRYGPLRWGQNFGRRIVYCEGLVSVVENR